MKILTLLSSRRFLPLFIVQFLGAFNDNVFRFALLTLISYKLASELGTQASVLNITAAGIFILPFFLFSGTGGLLADKYQKHQLIRYIKIFEIMIMLLAAVAFINSKLWLLLMCLGLTGLQSALFGPVKYGVLPSLLKDEELLAGNALFEAGTFLSILLGTIVGGLLILGEFGQWQVSTVLIACASVGWLASLFVPRVESCAPDISPSFNILKDSLKVFRIGTKHPEIKRIILGISWFWFLGYVIHSQLPPLTAEVLQADEKVSVILLVMFTIGIGSGSLLCSRIMHGEVSARYVPFAALLMSIFTLDLYYSTNQMLIQQVGHTLHDVESFLQLSMSWRILADMFLLSVAAGFYIVPLYTLLQKRAEDATRSRTIAANNIINAMFMVLASLLVLGALKVGFVIPDLFWMLAILNIMVAFYIMKIIPRQSLKTIGRVLLKLFYRVEVKGLENFPKDGAPYVIVSNHVSFLDGPLLMCFLPTNPVFAINTVVNEKWWAKIFTRFFEMFPIDPSQPMAIKGLIKMLRAGRHVVIFPEGRISLTGRLMKMYEGAGKIADMGNAGVIPVRIEGAEYTHFSRMDKAIRHRLFPKITITICPLEKIRVDDAVRGKTRRETLRRSVYDIMTHAAYKTTNINITLYESLCEAIKVHGAKHEVLEDIDRNPADLQRILLGSVVLGSALRKHIAGGNVGMMLPNAVGTAITFYSLQYLGMVAAMINFTMGVESMLSSLRAAKIDTVVTSRRFIELGQLEHLITAMDQQVTIIYLEDIKEQIGFLDKLKGMFIAKTKIGLLKHQRSSNEPGVILFTSGSEGSPKGVVLSHKNLLANRAQVKANIDFTPKDRFFNALPVFHSFGLGVGLVLPISSGIRTFLYPSPLHYKIIPELIYDTRSTVMFGTDTFLSGYAKHADTEDFQSTRYVVAGAEKLKPATKELWMNRFGVRIFEGYGVTETSPALSINTYSYYKEGTVGRFLPGINYKLEQVEGIQQGGRLWVQGDNVMMGYLKVDQPGILQPTTEGWHDTGDIVDVDAIGFISIMGRAKRFAKIGGEMVSLTQVEGWVAKLWSTEQHCICAVVDERKGEKLVLITTHQHADRKTMQQYIVGQGGAELMVPKDIIYVTEIPLLGSGKLDFPAIQKIADQST